METAMTPTPSPTPMEGMEADILPRASKIHTAPAADTGVTVQTIRMEPAFLSSTNDYREMIHAERTSDDDKSFPHTK